MIKLKNPSNYVEFLSDGSIHYKPAFADTEYVSLAEDELSLMLNSLWKLGTSNLRVLNADVNLETASELNYLLEKLDVLNSGGIFYDGCNDLCFNLGVDDSNKTYVAGIEYRDDMMDIVLYDEDYDYNSGVLFALLDYFDEFDSISTEKTYKDDDPDFATKHNDPETLDDIYTKVKKMDPQKVDNESSDNIISSINHTETPKFVNEDAGRISSGNKEHVNSPDHYQHIRLAHNEIDPQYYETIDIIEGVLNSLELDPFGSDCIGNALKYIMRAPYKGKMAEDLAKASWYLSRYSDSIKNDKDNKTDDADSKKDTDTNSGTAKNINFDKDIIKFVEDILLNLGTKDDNGGEDNEDEYSIQGPF